MRRLARRATLVAGALALAAVARPGPVAGQEQIDLHGQVRPRSELRNLEGSSRAFTQMRTRLGLAAVLGRDVRAFVQFQDVRYWGEESSTVDADADALDLHQGYVEVGHEAMSRLWLRAGRQEVALGGERLIGALDWVAGARAFDGLRGAVRLGDQGRLDVLGLKIREDLGGLPDADRWLLGGWAQLLPQSNVEAAAYVLREGLDTPDASRWRVTAGARFRDDTGPLRYRAEAAYQRDHRVTGAQWAYMLALRAGVPLDGDRGTLTAWYDRLSGDVAPGPGETAFNTLYATNHKFYGYADLFTDIPAHTQDRGLQDLAVKARWGARPDITLGLDAHHLRVVDATGLGSGRIAEELDGTVTWSGDQGLSLLGGLSYVVGGDTLDQLRGVDGDVVFTYLQLNAVF